MQQGNRAVTSAGPSKAPGQRLSDSTDMDADGSSQTVVRVCSERRSGYVRPAQEASVGLGGLEPPTSSLSEIDSQTPC
jgi:hypothetical protein